MQYSKILLNLKESKLITPEQKIINLHKISDISKFPEQLRDLFKQFVESMIEHHKHNMQKNKENKSNEKFFVVEQPSQIKQLCEQIQSNPIKNYMDKIDKDYYKQFRKINESINQCFQVAGTNVSLHIYENSNYEIQFTNGSNSSSVYKWIYDKNDYYLMGGFQYVGLGYWGMLREVLQSGIQHCLSGAAIKQLSLNKMKTQTGTAQMGSMDNNFRSVVSFVKPKQFNAKMQKMKAFHNIDNDNEYSSDHKDDHRNNLNNNMRCFQQKMLDIYTSSKIDLLGQVSSLHESQMCVIDGPQIDEGFIALLNGDRLNGEIGNDNSTVTIAMRSRNYQTDGNYHTDEVYNSKTFQQSQKSQIFNSWHLNYQCCKNIKQSANFYTFDRYQNGQVLKSEKNCKYKCLYGSVKIINYELCRNIKDLCTQDFLQFQPISQDFQEYLIQTDQQKSQAKTLTLYTGQRTSQTNTLFGKVNKNVK